MLIGSRASLFVAAVAGAVAALLAAAPPCVATTVVSITFDDGRANQWTARDILARHDMRATFYVVSGSLGTRGSLTWPQLDALHADGNEIGGHTLDHPHLPTLPPEEQQRQICDDRTALERAGLEPVSFAYPYGSHDALTESIVQACGYVTARRGGWGLHPDDSCTGPCPFAETLPPRNPFATLAASANDLDLAAIEGYVARAAQNGGGWVTLIFHSVCDDCSGLAITPADLDALLKWLEAQPDVLVRPVGEAMKIALPPAPIAEPPPVAPPVLAPPPAPGGVTEPAGVFAPRSRTSRVRVGRRPAARFSCPAPCRVVARLLLEPRAAAALGWPRRRRATVIGRGARTSPATRRGRLRIALTPAARRRLGPRRAVTAIQRVSERPLAAGARSR